MTSTAVAMVTAAAIAVVAAVPLAGWTLSAPDAAARHWYRGRRPRPARVGVTGAVAVAFALLAGRAAGWTATLPAWIALALVLAPLAVIDVEQHRLPDRLVATGYLLGAILLLAAAVATRDPARLARAAGAGAATLGAFLAVVLAAPAAMGLGDVKLIGLLGGYLGWLGWTQVFSGVFAGFVLGALAAVVLLASRRANLRTAFAFGPALMSGTLLVAALG